MIFNQKLKQKLRDLELENSVLRSLTATKDSATDVINDLIEGGISWYDYKQMDKAAQMNYWNDAQAVLKNPVFQNEINAYITSVIKHIALESKSHDETMANRTLIVGIEAFRDRIEAIENPNKEISTDAINEAI